MLGKTEWQCDMTTLEVVVQQYGHVCGTVVTLLQYS